MPPPNFRMTSRLMANKQCWDSSHYIDLCTVGTICDNHGHPAAISPGSYMDTTLPPKESGHRFRPPPCGKPVLWHNPQSYSARVTGILFATAVLRHNDIDYIVLSSTLLIAYLHLVVSSSSKIDLCVPPG